MSKISNYQFAILDEATDVRYIVSTARTADLATPDSEELIDMWVSQLQRASSSGPSAATPASAPSGPQSFSQTLADLIVYCQSVRFRSCDRMCLVWRVCAR